MIIDSIENIYTYSGINPRIWKGLELLNTDFSQLSDGRHEVDGDNLYFNLETYTTKAENNTPEAHDSYADIQCILFGEECMRVAERSSLTVTEAFPERDLTLHSGKTDIITVKQGRFAVFFPQDAHACGISCDKPTLCRKVVVKVKL